MSKLSTSEIYKCYALVAILWLVISCAVLEGNGQLRRGHTPIARSQRQIIANELATGISGTGTSDPANTQQQSIYQTDTDIDGIGGGIGAGVGGYTGGTKGRGVIPTLQTNRNLGGYGGYSGYGGYGGYGGKQGSTYGTGSGINRQGWRGFGAAKGGGTSQGGYKGASQLGQSRGSVF